jgi:xylulokinase
MALLLGIDFGTSYFKVGLFEASGNLRGLGRIAVETISPARGRAELPIATFWQQLRSALQEALDQARATPAEIAGISYSSQANTFVLLDERDQPLTPLVSWTDERADPVDPAVAAFGGSPVFHRTVGFKGLGAGFAAVKWRWFQAQQPALWSRTARVMTLPEYFTFALTGERAGDTSTAALTGLYATAAGGWWPPALDFFHVPPGALSRPLAPGTRCGETSPRARDLLGLPAGVPYAVGGLDHYIAAIGSGIGRLGDASISTGTVLAALQLVERVEPIAHCYHGPHFDGRFYRLAFDPAGAGQLEDFRRRHAPQMTIAQLAALAATVAPTDARTGNAGVPLGVGVRHIMDRIGATHRLLLERLHAPGRIARVIATGGGARSTEWLQIKADILNAVVVAPRCHERACLGAAAFGAIAAGLHSDIPAALLAMVHAEREVLPRPEMVAVYAEARRAGRDRSVIQS